MPTRGLLERAEEIEETQAPDHPHRLSDDLARHLRGARAAVDEHDRDLLDPESLSPCLEADLDLEGVAVRADAGPVDRLENLAAETLEAAGEILDAHAGDDPAVDVGAVREDQPRKGPVDDRDAVKRARAENEICILQLPEEFPQAVGIVGEIGVDLEHGLVVAVERPSESRHV